VDTGPGQHTLVADTAELTSQEAEQVLFQVAAGREVGVTTLGGDHRAAHAVGDDERLAEARARGDHRDIAAPGHARLQAAQLLFAEHQHTMRGRFQVIQQPRARGAQRAGEHALVDLPRQIRGHAAAVHDGAGDTDAEGGDVAPWPRIQEVVDGRLEAGEVAAGEGGLARESEAGALAFEEGERRLRAADVAGQDHATSRCPRRCP
jgi:hypothetical protein